MTLVLSWWPVLVAVLLSIGTTSVLRRWHARLSALATVRVLSEALRSLPQEQRLALLTERADGWAAELAEALSDSCSAQARLASAGELLADLDHRLTAQRRLPRQLIGITLTGHALCLLGGLAAGVRGPLVWLLPVCFASMAWLFTAGRAAERKVSTRREQAEQLVQLLIEDVIDEPMPQRRQMRWKSRRRR